MSGYDPIVSIYMTQDTFQWFYAFSIAPNTAAGTSVPRSSNTTKNPFLSAPSSTKRRLENEGGENYIFGDVRQPAKRSRLGKSLRSCMMEVYLIFLVLLKLSPENCRRVTNVADVNLQRYEPLAVC